MLQLHQDATDLRYTLAQGGKQVLVFLGVMIAIEEAVQVYEQAVEYRKTRYIVRLDLLYQFLQCMKYNTEIPVLEEVWSTPAVVSWRLSATRKFLMYWPGYTS